MNAKELYEENLDLILRITAVLCEKSRMQQADAEDIQSLVHIKMISAEYKVFRDCKNGKVSRSYLTMIIRNVINDFFRKKDGRYKPSETAMKLGELGLLLEKLIYRLGFTFSDACEFIKTMFKNQGRKQPSTQKLEDIYSQLQPKQKKAIINLNSGQMDIVATCDETAEDAAIDEEQEQQRQVLGRIISTFRNDLSRNDQILVQMRFADDSSISSIARTLGEKRYTVDKRLKALLQDLREEILRQGFSEKDILDILQDF